MSGSSALQTPAWMSSWWDRYLAPGDIRQQRQQSLSSTTSTPSSTKDNAKKDQPNIPVRIDAARKARRQNALLLGGAAFSLLSIVVGRRAVRKKNLAAYPHFVKGTGSAQKIDVPTFAQSNVAPKADGGLDAAEALFLATLGTFSVFMFGMGVGMKYFDIGDLEDLRDRVREGVGYDVYAGDTEADKEIEQWMAEVLARKDGVGDLKTTIVEKMAELAELEKKKQGERSIKELVEIRRKKEALEKEVGKP